jgi:hypothetical protein
VTRVATIEKAKEEVGPAEVQIDEKLAQNELLEPAAVEDEEEKVLALLNVQKPPMTAEDRDEFLAEEVKD